MNRHPRPATSRVGPIVVVSLSLLCTASPSSAQSSMNRPQGAGAENNMIELQSLQGQRGNLIQVTRGVFQSIHESTKTVAGNAGGSSTGKPPGAIAAADAPTSLHASAAGSATRPLAAVPPTRKPEARRAAAQRADRASLNPQPLPPVERARVGAPGHDRAPPANGIIIVGGKQAAGR